MEEEIATHSSTLARKIPSTEEPGRLQSMGLLRVGHDFTFTFHFYVLEKEMVTHFSVIALIIAGKGEPGRLLSMGLHRVEHNWNDLAATAAGAMLLSILMQWIWEYRFLFEISISFPLNIHSEMNIYPEVWNFVRNFWKVFHGNCTNIHCYQQSVKTSFFYTSSIPLISSFLVKAI